ncbi:MAG: hypothetical protein JRF52_04725 [Deltaproteobacteria bacterium]|nr:hypothetical protein [Deltaproteobacteria bacterium]
MPDSVKTVHFRWWVFWTGIFNIVAYAALMCPFTLKIFLGTSTSLSNTLGLGGTVLSMPENVNHVIMINILGLVVVFLGIFLIIASLDIEKRAWFVFWEGLTRIRHYLHVLHFYNRGIEDSIVKDDVLCLKSTVSSNASFPISVGFSRKKC